MTKIVNIILLIIVALTLGFLQYQASDSYRLKKAADHLSAKEYPKAANYYKKILRKRMIAREVGATLKIDDVMPGLMATYEPIVLAKQELIEKLSRDGELLEAEAEAATFSKIVRYFDTMIDASVEERKATPKEYNDFIKKLDAVNAVIYSGIYEEKGDFDSMVWLHSSMMISETPLTSFFLLEGGGSLLGEARFEEYIAAISDPDRVRTAKKELSSIYIALAIELDKKGDHTKAYKKLKYAFIADPKNSELTTAFESLDVDKYPRYNYIKVLLLEAAKDTASAKRLLNDIVRKGAADAEIFTKLSEYDLRDGDIKSATEHLLKAAELQKYPVATYYRLSDLYRESNDKKNAVKYLELGVDIDKDDYQKLLYHGNLQWESIINYYNSDIDVTITGAADIATDLLGKMLHPNNIVSARGELEFSDIGSDIEILLDLKTERSFNLLTFAANLRDQRYVIPKSVVYVSVDGKDFKEIGVVEPQSFKEPGTKTIYIKGEQKARYVKVIMRKTDKRVNLSYIIVSVD